MSKFSITWSVRWWSDDAVGHDEHGTELIEADNHWLAQDTVRRRWLARVDYPHRPLLWRFMEETGEWTGPTRYGRTTPLISRTVTSSVVAW